MNPLKLARHFVLLVSLVVVGSVCGQDCSTTMTCMRTNNPPVLDADLSEWDNVEAYTSVLTSIPGSELGAGNANLKCLYDEVQVYFAFEIPGDYRFSRENNQLCASIATMMKIGDKASFLNMGGCPDALDGCENGVPSSCDDYRVDIGGHWELKDTEQNTYYGFSDAAALSSLAVNSSDTTTGTGDDPTPANKDDEYAVSPYCRFDDDDASAGNEWAAAWAHTNPVEGEFGTYQFEMSRKLKTPSTFSDAQLSPGDTVQFGVAFWDPFELGDSGWSDAGHYLTGCANKWIDLELSTSIVATTNGDGATNTESATDGNSSSASTSSIRNIMRTSLTGFAAVFAVMIFAQCNRNSVNAQESKFGGVNLDN